MDKVLAQTAHDLDGKKVGYTDFYFFIYLLLVPLESSFVKFVCLGDKIFRCAVHFLCFVDQSQSSNYEK